MKVDVILTAGEIKAEKIKDKIVVIIDVLRATSVMVKLLPMEQRQYIHIKI